MAEEEAMKKTSNVQLPTPNAECRDSEFPFIGCSAFGVCRRFREWISSGATFFGGLSI